MTVKWKVKLSSEKKTVEKYILPIQFFQIWNWLLFCTNPPDTFRQTIHKNYKKLPMNLEQNTIFEGEKNHKIDCIAQSYYIETTKNNALDWTGVVC